MDIARGPGRRPDPDALLRRMELEAGTKKERGRLKIFFGYAAGVGKTYTMLNSAGEAKRAGLDVVAGYIEPHTRPETLALLEGLETLPPLNVQYKGITLREFDLDGALARRPRLILVDELAHTNAEVCRHHKRYQDIQELLKAGIDVYTTVNVQHIESLNDIIAAITGVIVRERVPDSVFDEADQVELVDIEPDDLILRLNQGKIYQERQAEKALKNFFIPENLIALREIALRRTADRVSRRAEEKAKVADKFKLAAEEHILICLSSSPSNAKVIRTAARMADAFHGAFTALYVEGGRDGFSEEAARLLKDNLRLAEQLGARVSTVYGEDAAAQIAEYAKVSGVTKIVIGRSNNKRRFWGSRKNLVERLTDLAPNLDFYIIPDNLRPYRRKKAPVTGRPLFSWPDTIRALAILVVTTLISLGFDLAGFSEANIITLYILGVLFISLATSGRVYGVLASLVSVFVFNFFFTEPLYTFQAVDSGYPVTFLVMFSASFITSTLTKQVKNQAHKEALKARRTEILLETSQKLQRAGGGEEILKETACQLRQLLDASIVCYPVSGQGLAEPLYLPKAGEEGLKERYTSRDEESVALWVLKNNKHAGATTNTLPGAKCLYLAIRDHDMVFAVIGAALERRDSLDAFERSLMAALLGECALAMEKERLGQAKRQIELKAQQEQLRANLLRTISHDLRTPLTSISGNAGVLMANSAVLDEQKKQSLYGDIFDDAQWLINLVENLLSVTRIENGSLALQKTPELLSEIIEDALEHVNRRKDEHRITVQLESDFLMAKMDSRLIIQVLINLINNAIAYTPAGSRIDLSAYAAGDMIRVEVADNGAGIPDAAKERIFDLFYTAENRRGDGKRGMGLGLALCRSIINAHGGEISVRDNQPRGAVFSFTLQAQEVDYHE